jgi:hypothetical protein
MQTYSEISKQTELNTQLDFVIFKNARSRILKEIFRLIFDSEILYKI